MTTLKRSDSRHDLQHGPFSAVSFRQCCEDADAKSFASKSSCVLERCVNESSGSSWKVFCEVDGPKPTSTGNLLSQSPLVVRVSTRDNETPNWWRKQIIEKSIHSALIPSLIVPPTGWAAASFDVHFVVEVPTGAYGSKISLHDELSSLQLIVNCVNAGSIALMSRGIPVRDFVVGSIVSMSNDKSNGRLLIDPTPEEVSSAFVVAAGTVMPSLGQLTSIWWHTSAISDFSMVYSSELYTKIMNGLVACGSSLRPIMAQSLETVIS